MQAGAHCLDDLDGSRVHRIPNPGQNHGPGDQGIPQRLAVDPSTLSTASRPRASRASALRDKIDVQHVYTEVTLAIGSQFIRNTQDDSESIADLRRNTHRLPYCQMWGNTGHSLGQHPMNTQLRLNAVMRGRGEREINAPSNVIVRHDSHMRKSGVTRTGIEHGSHCWEASSPITNPFSMFVVRMRRRLKRLPGVIPHSVYACSASSGVCVSRVNAASTTRQPLVGARKATAKRAASTTRQPLVGARKATAKRAASTTRQPLVGARKATAKRPVFVFLASMRLRLHANRWSVLAKLLPSVRSICKRTDTMSSQRKSKKISSASLKAFDDAGDLERCRSLEDLGSNPVTAIMISAYAVLSKSLQPNSGLASGASADQIRVKSRKSYAAKKKKCREDINFENRTGDSLPIPCTVPVCAVLCLSMYHQNWTGRARPGGACRVFPALTLWPEVLTVGACALVQILSGNTDTSTVVSHRLMPPVFASQLRVLPYSVHRRTVCLRVELRGCLFDSESHLSLLYIGYSREVSMQQRRNAMARGNGRTPRKLIDQWNRRARFPPPILEPEVWRRAPEEKDVNSQSRRFRVAGGQTRDPESSRGTLSFPRH
ncbi:hypothetical protein PR048_022122 [Dryococelus australis]|uniref:F5/8 type C domain-containing protein n=1 Tax=Dryococelus australis TaxID=614101 RepID=A0ABQ9H051_9NEOP|nr:hypothetical protein PR048_022122 [Dryococelus australis]